MKALIRKDAYVLWKQLKYFLLMVLVLSCIPGAYNSIFIVLYAAMLPYTALAYDERSKWDQLARTMPFSDWDIVLSKYVLGWILTLISLVAAVILHLVLFPLLGRTPAPGSLLPSFFMALCILAVSLPPLFRFGVEKARLSMFLVISLICGGTGALVSLFDTGVAGDAILVGGRSLTALLGIALPVTAIALTAISIPLAVKCYRKHLG